MDQSGDVLIRYDVQPDGRITNVFVLKSSGHEILDVAAIACVYERWRNIPATRHGFNVASRGQKALIRFALFDNDLGHEVRSQSATLFFLMAALVAAACLAFILWLDRRRPPAESWRDTQD